MKDTHFYSSAEVILLYHVIIHIATYFDFEKLINTLFYLAVENFLPLVSFSLYLGYKVNKSK